MHSNHLEGMAQKGGFIAQKPETLPFKVHFSPWNETNATSISIKSVSTPKWSQSIQRKVDILGMKLKYVPCFLKALSSPG